MKNIRLLHLVKSLDIGGIERTTINYANELSKEFEFVGIFAKKTFFNHTNLISSKVILISSIMELSFFNLPIILLRLIYIIKKYKVTILHYHHRVFIPVVFLIKFIFAKIKIVYTHHNNFSDFTNKLIFADKIISISHITDLDIKKYKPHSVVFKITHQLPPINNTALIIDSIRTRIGYIGRIEKYKGVDEVFDLFLRLNKSTEKEKYGFYFFGNGNYLKILRKMIKKTGLTNYQIVTSEWDLSRIYGSVDIVIYPTSKIEGFGMVILEAITFRKVIFIKNNSLVSSEFDSNLINYFDDVNELVDKIEQNLATTYQYNRIFGPTKFERCIRSYLHIYSN